MRRHFGTSSAHGGEAELARKLAALERKYDGQFKMVFGAIRGKAYAASNFIMVEAYWRIGQRIVQEEQGGKDRAEYGSHLVRNLARQLGEEFGSGVSVANLWNFRQFYLTFPDIEKSYALRSQLTWTHWRLVMRVENTAARDDYVRETAEQGWNTRQLERNIATQSYKRLLAVPSHRPPAATVKSTGRPAEFWGWDMAGRAMALRSQSVTLNGRAGTNG